MSRRPYPDRERARHQVERGRAVRPQPASAGTPAWLESDEFHERMRRLGVPAYEAMANARRALAAMPRWSEVGR